MARAMWRATVGLGKVGVPVKLYAAAEDRDVHFRLVHREDLTPVAQRMVDPETGDEVASEDVKRGLEIERGLFVVLDEDERAALEPKASRAIEVTRFVPREAIDLSYYDRPYYLGPDGAIDDYFALVEAIAASGRVGVARWVLRKRRNFGVLEVRDGHLALVSLRSSDEVVAAASLPDAGDAPVRPAERSLAEQLITALDGPFDPKELQDDYRDRVLAFIAAKAKGKKPKAVRERMPRKTTGDLASVLKKSIAAAKKARRAA